MKHVAADQEDQNESEEHSMDFQEQLSVNRLTKHKDNLDELSHDCIHDHDDETPKSANNGAGDDSKVAFMQQIIVPM